MKSNHRTRRTFIGGASATAAGLGTYTNVRAQEGGANDKLVVAVMGMGRGGALAQSFHGLDNVEVAMVCDVDKKRSDAAARSLGPGVKSVTDFRRILDRKDIDILVIATCNHWHAPAAILGCEAGKHIYVEKPCSHNPHEG